MNVGATAMLESPPGSNLAANATKSGSPQAPTIDPRYIVIGMLCGFAPSGQPLVDYSGNPAGRLLEGRSLVPIEALDVNRPAALLFEQADLWRPVIVGLLQAPVPASEPGKVEKGGGAMVEVDGDRLVISADREIVLRCGEASLTLTRAGKVLIRGNYLLSRSSGVNRIKGGSVQIN
jgi:hypothetical protein